MMKVCHVTSAHSRYDLRICEKECVSLARKGYEVYLIVNDRFPDEDYKGVHILSTKMGESGRLYRILRTPRQVLWKALEVDAEIYHLHDPELLMISDKLRKFGKKVIYDAHEDTEKQIETKLWIPPFFRWILGKLFGIYSHDKFRKMTALVSVTPSIVEKLKKYNRKTIMITNYPLLEESYEGENLDKKVNNENKYVFFAGGIVEQWCHENIVQAISNVEGVRYCFAGRGREEYIEKIKKLCGGRDVGYLGILSHHEVMNYYQDAVAGLAILKKSTQVGKTGTLGNTKLFEIMKAGRPVICSDLNLWREIVERYNCGICVDCNDISAIADAVRYLSKHPLECDEMGRNGRKAIEVEYNWSTQEKKLYAFYKSIVGLP